MAYIFDLVDTWASGGGPYTSIKMNATDNDSGSASLLMDLQVGGASKFKVAKSGDVTLGSSSILMDAVGGSITAGGTYSSNAAIGFRFLADLFLRRRGAANLALGAADAASGVQAQTLSVQSITGTNASAAAYPFKITGAQGTGNAAGGSIIFQVAPAGGAGAAQNTLVDALTIGSDKSTRLEGDLNFSGTGTVNIQANVNFLFIRSGTYRWGIGQDFIATSSTAFVGFSSGGTDIGGTTATNVDTRLYRDAANTLALRTGTAAQRFNVYNTYTSSTNYEAFKIDWITTANTVLVGTEKGSGGGTARALEFQTDGTTRLTIATTGLVTVNGGNLVLGETGVLRTRYINNGNNSLSMFDFVADGTGTATFAVSGSAPLMRFGGTTSSFPAIKRSTTALEVRLADDSAYTTFSCASFNAYSGITLRGSTENTRRLAWNGVGQIRVQSDGVFTIMNDAGTDFNRLQFGGTDATYPALKRSTTFLQARLADDSAACGFSAANVQAATAYTVATLPGTPGTGMIARVTDASAPVIGTTVAGGGAAYALVNYNGANWTVIGV
jgi:hypothetical protein